MVTAKYTLWHILFNISMYTLIAIGVMYAVFFYIKHQQKLNQANNPLTESSQQQQTQLTQSNPMLAMMLKRFGIQAEQNTNQASEKQNSHQVPQQVPQQVSVQNVTFPQNGLQSLTEQDSGGQTVVLHADIDPDEAIIIESSVQIEVGKTLFVARCGTNRFLLASTPQGLVKLSRLDEETPDITSRLILNDLHPPQVSQEFIPETHPHYSHQNHTDQSSRIRKKLKRKN